MNRSLAAKLTVLPLVMFATWAVTSKIIAKLTPAVEVAPGTGPAPGDGPTKTLIKREGPSDDVVAPPNRRMLKRNTLLSHSIVVDVDGVHVNAQVGLVNRVGGDVYLWRLSAHREADGQTVLDVPYENQLFEIDPSGEMSPTFSEVVQLPAGKYKVFLTLYEVPKGTDLATLRDERKAISDSIIRFFEVVEIK